MNSIKVGDEVLVKTNVLSLDQRHVDISFKYENGNLKVLSVPKNICQKIEPTFIITPQDVGRFARTRDGRKAWVYAWNGEDLEIFGEADPEYYTISYSILDGDDNCCNKSGRYTSDRENELDLVAWWDE